MVSREESYHSRLEEDHSDGGGTRRGTNNAPNEVLGGTTDNSVGTDQPDAKLEKSLFKSVSDIIVESAHSVKDVVSGHGIHDKGDGERNSVLQAVGTRISQTAITMKETVVSGTHEKLLTGYVIAKSSESDITVIPKCIVTLETTVVPAWNTFIRKMEFSCKASPLCKILTNRELRLYWFIRFLIKTVNFGPVIQFMH